MITISHQLSKSNVYIPNWEIEYLFLGTFNPMGGDQVPYYYGRPKNQTWKLLSDIFQEVFNPSEEKTFFKSIKKYKIACVDLIHEVKAPCDFEQKILGMGYKDTSIINKKVSCKFNTDTILDLIYKNPNIKVYSTWGIGPNLASWRAEVNKIPNLINLKSPSMAARVPKGCSKFNYMLNDWTHKINLNCNLK